MGEWTESVVLPSSLECSTFWKPTNSVGDITFVPIGGTRGRTGRRANTSSTLASAGSPYYLTTRIDMTPSGPDTPHSQVAVDVGLPDLVVPLPLRVENHGGSPYAIQAGSVIEIGAAGILNRGIFDSEAVRYRFVLAGNPTGGNVELASRTVGPLKPGDFVDLSGTRLTIPAGLPAGRYVLQLLAAQTSGARECTMSNNSQAVPMEVSP